MIYTSRRTPVDDLFILSRRECWILSVGSLRIGDNWETGAMPNLLFYGCLLVIWTTPSAWQIYCPVRSPTDQLVFITDRPSSSLTGLTKTQCTMQCQLVFITDHPSSSLTGLTKTQCTMQCQLVFITNNPSSSLTGLTKTQCTMQCQFCSTEHQCDNCRCFNYNSTSMNCSLFNYEPTNYAVDQSASTKAYQVRLSVISQLS